MLTLLNNFIYKINKKRLLIKGYIKSQKHYPDRFSNDPIDFVVTWVDGTDSSWEKQKQYYESKQFSQVIDDNGEERYRNWDLFKYWFRAVEKYAPWVHKVYLVTCGHIPQWLNTESDKLVVVNHKDFIPSEYLPTFSSIPIELNIHRISGLSEKFVYFNDDMFLTKPVLPSDFFVNGMPKYCGIAYPLKNHRENDSFQHQLFSVLGIVNDFFSSKISGIIKNNPEKWFSREYGKALKYNMIAYEESYIQGMYFSHLGCPFRKKTFEKVWNTIPDELNKTSMHRFRMPTDIMHQVFSIWDILDGNFYPVSADYYGAVFASLESQIDDISRAVLEKEYRMICINDSRNIKQTDFEILKTRISNIMQCAFPKKSAFEIFNEEGEEHVTPN